MYIVKDFFSLYDSDRPTRIPFSGKYKSNMAVSLAHTSGVELFGPLMIL